MDTIIKSKFVIIGKELKVYDNKHKKGLVTKLNSEILNNLVDLDVVAKKENGQIKGIWTMMTNTMKTSLTLGFVKNQGIYFTGVEAEIDAITPAYYQKLEVAGYHYWVVESINGNEYPEAVYQMRVKGLKVISAVFIFTDLRSNKKYWYLPYRSNDS